MKKGIQLVALLLTVVMSSCTGGKDKAAVKQEDEKPRVKVADVTARPVDQIQDYTATVEAEVKNNIAPSSPVRIDRILVEVGDRVSKGQKLVQMDAANLTQTKLQLDNQKIEFNRIDELYKVGGASKSEWDAAKMQLDVKQTAYDNLVENTFLLSPINGVITARNYANGDMVGHTGIYDAIEKAVKAIDECVKDTVEAAKANDYEVIIIADHGNADHALNEDGTPNTAHSLNPVPFVYVTENKNAKVENGVLADVAPSILHILGMPQPADMTGRDLIK